MNLSPLNSAAVERPPRLELMRWLAEDASRLKPNLNSYYQKSYTYEQLPLNLHSPYSKEELGKETNTKIPDKYVSYNPKDHSAAMLNNNDNYYRALNLSFDLLESSLGIKGKGFLSLESNPKLMPVIKSELEKALDRYGFHEISGARYAAFSVYKARNNGEYRDDKWHFVSSSNTDPLIQDFHKLEYRRCAEDTASIMAHVNGLDKLKYLFLYRAPYPEAYAKKNDEEGIFPFFKLVPCKTCSKHLKKIMEDKGSLIIVTSAEQGKRLEESLSKTNKSGVVDGFSALDSKYSVLKDQKPGDFAITYSKKNKEGDCFIQIKSESLGRLLVENETGANVQAKSESHSGNRSLISLDDWLKSESLEAKLGDLSSFLDRVIRKTIR